VQRALASWRQQIMAEQGLSEDETSANSSGSDDDDARSKAIQLKIKIGAAGHTGRLDLTSMCLSSFPMEILELTDLEVGN
jgi:hypothetical protein